MLVIKEQKQFGGSLKTFVSGGGALDPEGGILNLLITYLTGLWFNRNISSSSCNPIDDIRIETVEFHLSVTEQVKMVKYWLRRKCMLLLDNEEETKV